MSKLNLDTLVADLLAGNRLALARAITHVENQQEQTASLLRLLFPHTGHAQIIGVTGAPGTGKSTLVTVMAQRYRLQGKTVAIVAIDPTSPFTGGALLGDRVRMRALSGDPGVFVRSMATRGSLGGLSLSTNDVVHLLDAAGFDCILVETVGVGQAEVEIASMAHTTLVVEAPGMGDEVQAIKAGILEIADLLVVNKADRPGVDNTVRALEMMLELEAESGQAIRHHGQLMGVKRPEPAVNSQQAEQWRVEVLKTVAASGEGIENLLARVDAHFAWLDSSGQRLLRERVRIAHTLENIIRSELQRRIRNLVSPNAIETMIETVRTKQSDPYTAALELLKGV
ncbi:MAG: methylmalonyl Co-A mutase-associated GTPase MeaB [Caldilineaceae bacterium]